MKRRGAPYGSTVGHENHCVKHEFYAVMRAFQKGPEYGGVKNL